MLSRGSADRCRASSVSCSLAPLLVIFRVVDWRPHVELENANCKNLRHPKSARITHHVFSPPAPDDRLVPVHPGKGHPVDFELGGGSIMACSRWMSLVMQLCQFHAPSLTPVFAIVITNWPLMTRSRPGLPANTTCRSMSQNDLLF